MSGFQIRTLTFAAAAAFVGLVAAPVMAQPAGVTKDEVKCESGTGKALSKFIGAKGKCVQKCLGTARKTSGPYTDCFPPFGGATATCLTDPVKGAEAKATAAIVKACAKDCPECYGQLTCDTGQPFVGNTSGQLDVFGSLVYCTEAAGNTPSKAEGKCEDAVSKTLAKFVAAKSKCYDKCQQSVFKGKLPEGSCDAPTPSDAATAACIQKAEEKSVAGIDKACNVPGAKPACYNGAPTPDSGSPSGAFLD
jgi:hypothetical protein